MDIIWKPVVGYEETYLVSNEGLIKSKRKPNHKETIVKIYTDSCPPTVKLKKGNKYYNVRVAEAVACAFLGLPYGTQLEFVDKDRNNCRVNNIMMYRGAEDLEGEVWKDIPELDGVYQASNMGRIKALQRVSNYVDGRQRILPEIIMKPIDNDDGYLWVYIQYNKKQYRRPVHRIVCSLFVDNPDNKPEVNHIDGDKWNNKADNLEWATRTENRNHAIKTGLSSDNFCIQCIEDGNEFYSLSEAAKFYNVDATSIANHTDKYPSTCPRKFTLHFTRIDEVTNLHKDSTYVVPDGFKLPVPEKPKVESERDKRWKDYKPCYCVETGEQFNSYHEASVRFNITSYDVRMCCEKHTQARGYHFLHQGDTALFGVENLEGEEWRDIPGYEGRYQISSMKRVKSVVRGSDKLLRIKGGCVSLSLDGRMRDLSINKIYSRVFKSSDSAVRKTKSLF